MNTIAKGTLVTVRTTNGGEGTGRLLETYRPTYSVYLEIGGRPVDISGWRVESVQVAGAVV